MTACKLVSVNIVTFNGAHLIRKCLDSVFRQTYGNIEVRVFDNASTDGTLDIVRSEYPGVTAVDSPENLMFAKAHNRCMDASRGEFILPLNQDVVLDEHYVHEMVQALEQSGTIGSACGKLYRGSDNLNTLNKTALDSTGMYFTLNHRHVDRGAGEADVGRYDAMEKVFAVTGAAPLYKREMLEDIRIEGECFDEDFVYYREDADLSWRAQILGWEAVYTPLAVGWHLRTVVSEDRVGAGPRVNMHSVKNRFLMRIKNETLLVFLKTFFPTLLRDLQVIVYVLFVERESIPGLLFVVRNLGRTLRKRRQIMRKRRARDSYLARWFSNTPVTGPM